MKTPLTSTQAASLTAGTELIVLDNKYGFPCKIGETVKFYSYRAEIDEMYVTVKGSSQPLKLSWMVSRFALAPQAVQRDNRGRFKGTQPAVKRPAPSVLRPGSLYGVKRKRGVVVARLRKQAHGEWLVFSEHDKAPFLARREKVTLADDTEVKGYLQQAAQK